MNDLLLLSSVQASHLLRNLILPMVWVVIIWPVNSKVIVFSTARTKIVNIISHFLGKWNTNELEEGPGHIVSGIGILADQFIVFDSFISTSKV